jgi:hypothetical protein
MESITEKRFGKYNVTLELFEEGDDQRSYCDIINPKTGACGSIALAEDGGFIETQCGTEELISNTLINKIRTWALKHGY